MKMKTLRKILLILLIPLSIIGAAFAGFYAYRIIAEQKSAETAGLVQDPNARIGTLDQTEAERIRELEEIVNKSMITMSINATPCFRNGEGNLMLENPSENGSRITVALYPRGKEEQEEEKLYQSGALDPGQYIDNVRLDRELAAGEYPCTAYFLAYDLSDDSYIGKAAIEITIYVEE
ncbi:hypothetical protein [Anaerolentibacter hominis]|uniref:hypothetical protein n=1 Tax=Anaerolentibacter hominis TaxID=3079009 RepID=UPI0031B85506